MDAAVLVGRLLLASVFAMAAVTKLRDPRAAARALRDLGAPARAARPAAVLLPVAELATAAGLLIESVAVAAGVAAFILLAIFTAAIANALRHHRAPDCGCFGELSSGPVSKRTLVRNVVLMAVALLVALEGPGTSLAAPLEILIVACAVTCGILLGAKRRPAGPPAALVALRSPTLDRVGIPIGADAPDFELDSPCNGRTSLESLRSHGLPVVLIFLGAGCGSCAELHPHLGRWQVTLSERLAIAVVMSGGVDAAFALCSDHGVQNVLVDDDANSLWKPFRVGGTPSAMAVGPDGRVASPMVRGVDALEELVRQTIRNGSQTTEPWTKPAPAR